MVNVEKGSVMKLYKFRPLANEEDFNRARVILETGNFWCSQFTELNDPMEGVFTIQASQKVKRVINEIGSQKLQFKLCSFSSGEVFENPLMWGYYANGFRGMVIEIEVGEKVKKNWEVDYVNTIKDFDKLLNGNNVKTLLMTKLSVWQHEAEYRFLVSSRNNYHRIGEIHTIYFGDPYRKVANRDQIFISSASLKAYEERRRQLNEIAISKGIWTDLVEIRNNKVVIIGSKSKGLFQPVSKKEFRNRILKCPQCKEKVSICDEKNCNYCGSEIKRNSIN